MYFNLYWIFAVILFILQLLYILLIFLMLILILYRIGRLLWFPPFMPIKINTWHKIKCTLWPDITDHWFFHILQNPLECYFLNIFNIRISKYESFTETNFWHKPSINHIHRALSLQLLAKFQINSIIKSTVILFSYKLLHRRYKTLVYIKLRNLVLEIEF